ncbi:hypothetical protein HPT27_01720 [Permianibacter sp. IMCC34836]|uniref:hypothetical protein n=1 Tax=Permianibacter fluminis TaxID=2738515 RepID=UPI0015529CE4|nr:hypothetical protein [Permianibacter fluminis]NQD35720.1 hypothetical protein [Permianibacter fluminis]
MLLLLKLTLVPTLILLISLAGARWGSRVAGILAGFPIVAGPILLFLALEQGVAFAAQSAISTLYGLLAISAYCLSFCWLALRLRWWLCLPLAWLVFVAVASLLRLLPISLPLAAMLSVLVITLAPRAFPQLVIDHAPQPVPRSELFWRLGSAAMLVWLLTTVADWLGPGWSGLLTLFPVAGSVLGAFAARGGGAGQATALLRGMITGLYGLWLFFVLAALLLPRLGLLSFLPALLAAVAVQAALLRRR